MTATSADARGGDAALEKLEGALLIKRCLKTLPERPGVYRMLDAKGDALYVGKAKALKKRVASYTRPQALTARLKRMVASTRAMEFVETGSEVEALLLEANMIKRLKPRYNIILRDDKSFPYIHLTMSHAFPRVRKHRGAKIKGDVYFGPFASAGAVDETLNALLRAFPMRNCSDAIFQNRTRPCLQHQIKRCCAPCVGKVSEEEYAELVAQASAFLQGRSRDVRERLERDMNAAAEKLEFETAAALRDRIKALSHISAKQDVNTMSVDDADVIALHQEGGKFCVQVFFYRAGRNYGNRAYDPAHAKDMSDEDAMEGFLGQFYADRAPPPLILTSHEVARASLFEEAFAAKIGKKVRLRAPMRGGKRKLIEAALTNAKAALGRRLAERAAQAELLQGLAERFGLDQPPNRIEIYDNSHIMGTNAIGAFVVAGPEGFDKKSYRTFKIKSDALSPGDDYAMMREVLGRRFKRLVKEGRDGASWPDLLLIDGGKGQLEATLATLRELGVDDVPAIGVAKGPDRNAGRERFFVDGREPLSLDPKDPVLYFIQVLRDEAHRFAIQTHRARRAKATSASSLDEIPGIGAKRKKALLAHFGSAREVARAGLRDLEAAPGVDKRVAQLVHSHFNEQG